MFWTVLETCFSWLYIQVFVLRINTFFFMFLNLKTNMFLSIWGTCLSWLYIQVFILLRNMFSNLNTNRVYDVNKTCAVRYGRKHFASGGQIRILDLGIGGGCPRLARPNKTWMLRYSYRFRYCYIFLIWCVICPMQCNNAQSTARQDVHANQACTSLRESAVGR